MAVVPTEGQLQALFWIPSIAERPVAVARPSGWNLNAAPDQDFTGTPGSAAETAWLAYGAYLTADRDFLLRRSQWFHDFRGETGLGTDRYNERQLTALARSARAVLAAELCGVEPSSGEATDTWTDPTGAVHTVRALPAGLFGTAVGYLARAMWYDGVSKGDMAYWLKVDALTKMWAPESPDGGSEVNGESISAVNRSPDSQYWTRGPEESERAAGPAGTERMVERSGAMRMIAPYVRRRLVEVNL